jgi:phosphoribosyl 1,2-cyclic phosphodiesterase
MPASVHACVLTHEHSDHVGGAARAARRYGWTLFASAGTKAHSSTLRAATVRTFAAGAGFTVGDLEVATYATPHDAAEPIGVAATCTRTGARAAVFTDVGHVTAAMRAVCADVDLLVLESNHDELMLANGPYPRWLQARISGGRGHLSNRAASQLVREVLGGGRLRHLVLAHLSEKNNTPQVALGAMRPVLKRGGFRGTLRAAAQDRVVGPVGAATGARQLELGLAG